MGLRFAIAVAAVFALLSCSTTPPDQEGLPSVGDFVVNVPHHWVQEPVLVSGNTLLHTVDPDTLTHCMEETFTPVARLRDAGEDEIRKALPDAAQTTWAQLFRREWTDVAFKSITPVEVGGWPASRATGKVSDRHEEPYGMSGIMTISHGKVYTLACIIVKEHMDEPHPDVDAFIGSFRPRTKL